MPRLMEAQVREVDYGTFMKMIDDKEIGLVEIQPNQIMFTDKDQTVIYKTGVIDDPTLVQRLYDSGAKFSAAIIEEESSFLSALLSWVLPMVVFILLGQFLTRQMMKKAGGGSNSMMFNMGKSNAKVYVQSSGGIKFSDVAGEDEAK